MNILLTCTAAVALAPVLGMPWFAAAVESTDTTKGSVELLGEAIARWFTGQGATSTGHDVLTSGKTALLAIGAVTALLALAMLVPPMRASVRGLVKLIPLAAPMIVLVQILTEAAAAGVEPRYGGFVALALTSFMASCAIQAGEMRESKPAPKAYKPGAGRAF